MKRCSWLAAACLLLLNTVHAAESVRTPDLSGMWFNRNPVDALTPVGGGKIPFTAEGKKLYEASTAALKAEAAKTVERNDLRRCLPLGPVRILDQPYPMKIVQKGDLFVLIHEHNHSYEIVYLNQKPDPDRDWAYMGNSVGSWSKDAMVITTIGVKEGAVLDNSGLPHSESLTLKRVLRKLNDDQLEIVTTITDPMVYSKPWSVRHVLQHSPSERIEEYTCGQATLETRYTRQKTVQSPGQGAATDQATGQPAAAIPANQPRRQ